MVRRFIVNVFFCLLIVISYQEALSALPEEVWFSEPIKYAEIDEKL